MQMLQALLSGRFNLVLRHQPREMPVYVLTVDRGGPKLEENVDKGPSQMSPVAGGETKFHNVSMTTFTGQFLTGRSGRPVIDKTGLSGSCDFDLKSANPVLNASPAEDGPALPDLVTALREQLGLKLDAQRAPVDFLVVDQVEKPSAN
jgi:uncharacterized protein (TIGR03435 family)